jgi:hypothetical protein
MGLFNLIETFFYLSLGVCFVLILLLVYHFKQRILNLEQKSDTMVDIISNVVKEITNLKNSTTTRPTSMFEFFENPLCNPEFSQPIPFPEMSFYMKDKRHPTSSSMVVEEISVEDNKDTENLEDNKVDEEEDEIENDSGDEQEDESDNEDGLEEEDETDQDEDEDEEDEEEEKDEFELQESEIIITKEQEETNEYISEHDLQDVSITNVSSENKDDDSTVRIVSIPLNQSIQSEIFDVSEDIESESEQDEPIELMETEPILVNKLDETITSDISPETTNSIEKKERQDSYRKMNVQQLRALVISNGLSTNTSKLNKTELIKLLESMDE